MSPPYLRLKIIISSVIIILVILSTILFIQANSTGSLKEDDPKNGVYTVVQEIRVLASSGNATFIVDSKWDAIVVNIICDSDADISWMMYFTGNASQSNETYLETQGGKAHYESGESSLNYYSLIPPGNYSNMFGIWVLEFNVEKGQASILIEKLNYYEPSIVI